MFVDILIAFPLWRNPTQPTLVGFKHLMIGWGKLSEKRTSQTSALSLFLVPNAADCMVPVALVEFARRGLFEGGIF